jgi:hypothetical protein
MLQVLARTVWQLAQRHLPAAISCHRLHESLKQIRALPVHLIIDGRGADEHGRAAAKRRPDAQQADYISPVAVESLALTRLVNADLRENAASEFTRARGRVGLTVLRADVTLHSRASAASL